MSGKDGSTSFLITCISELACHAPSNCQVEVCGLKHYEGSVAPQLQPQSLDSVRALGVENLTNTSGASETET